MRPKPEQNPGPEPRVAGPLRDVWLRFHEKELCQDLDTVFVLHPKGMEVWCRVDDEKSYQRFLEMLEPLRSAFEIEVYATRPVPEKKSKDEEEPPPSLWNNDTLQRYLSDNSRNIPVPGEQDPSLPPSRRSVLKQRLMLWAEQVLSRNRKVRRYAADLPELARVGFGSGAEPAAKVRAVAICLAHAQSLDKNLSRLSDNISEALPPSHKASRSSDEPEKPRLPSSPVELVAMASAQARQVAERIHLFVYPQEYTVNLDDLKQSSLLEALREVRRILAELQKGGGSAR